MFLLISNRTMDLLANIDCLAALQTERPMRVAQGLRGDNL